MNINTIFYYEVKNYMNKYAYKRDQIRRDWVRGA